MIDILQQQIYLFVTKSCPWSTKMVEECKQHGVLDKINVCWIDSKDAAAEKCKKIYSDLNVQGVPVMRNIKSNKHVVGYKPMDQLCGSLF